MKKLVVFTVSIASMLLANAQVKSDPDAKAVLDAVSAKFKNFKSPLATFTYKIENAAGKALSTKQGSVAMKGNKYHVTISGQEIFSDGSNVWTYDKAANEVTVTKLDNGSANLTPQKLFSNFYDKDFLYKLNGETKQGGKTVQEIEMTPVDKTRPFHKVYVWIDKLAKTLYSTRVLEKNGNRYSYTVTKLNPSAAVPEDSFVFDKKKFPGVEVVDLR